MDCMVFRKRLNDLVEDNIAYDLKDAMLQHIVECEECRTVYEDELSLDAAIKKGLSIDSKAFKSSRTQIMKSIDKNKYGTSPMKKFMNHLRKYRGTYTSIAAVITVAIVITPYIGKSGLGFTAKKSENMSNAQIASKSSESFKNEMSTAKSAPKMQSNSVKGQAEAKQDTSLAITNRDIPERAFEKKALNKTYMPNFNNGWTDSVNKKYSATVEGRGISSEDEGVATIVVKEAATENQWAFNLLNNEDQQSSPKSVYWIDDEKLLVIVGIAQGHASKGGNLYMLNTNTAETITADPKNTANLQNGSEIMRVVSTNKLPNNQLEINIEVSVYDDDIQNEFHAENRIIIVPIK